ncbi:MAG: class I SAM-dependent methyltransferase [Leptospirillia bacterium]
MRRLLRKIVNRLAPAKQSKADDGLMYPLGHFYSPIPSLDEIEKRADTIFNRDRRTLPGIDLNEEKQLELTRQLSAYYPDMPFRFERSDDLRYFFDNPHYCQSDAVFLYSMLRHFRPKNVVEVGSGFSSAVMLDTNDRFLDRSVNFTFIEPFADRLRSRLREGDEASGKVRIIERFVQAVDLEVFESLGENDFLFIDSTHVSKVGSDVNHILFEIMPRIRPGVIVHFHDVFHPFEYPREWIFQGRFWNEDYMLRAFLSHNDAFEILIFNTFLAHFHEAWFAEHMPVCLENTGGALWLRRR